MSRIWIELVWVNSLSILCLKVCLKYQTEWKCLNKDYKRKSNIHYVKLHNFVLLNFYFSYIKDRVLTGSLSLFFYLFVLCLLFLHEIYNTQICCFHRRPRSRPSSLSNLFRRVSLSLWLRRGTVRFTLRSTYDSSLLGQPRDIGTQGVGT